MVKVLSLKQNSEAARRNVADWLIDKVAGARKVEISGWTVAPQGFSNQTVYFDARWVGDGVDREEHLVLRLLSDRHKLYLDAELSLQWRMMEAMSRHSDVPVPPLRWAEWDGAVLGLPFFIMAKVEGRIPASRFTGWMLGMTLEDRGRLMANALEAMARIHRLDWSDGFAFLAQPNRGKVGLDQYLSWVEDWCTWTMRGRPFGLFEQAVKIMRRRQPRNPPLGVVWGDSRIGNMIFTSDHSVAAVLDWEMATLGPAEVDLAWWFMFQSFMSEEIGIPLPEGMPSRAETIERYERLIGRPIEDIEYYDTLAAFRFAIIHVRLADLCIERGVLDPKSTLATGNIATRMLARTLDLPVPDLSPDCAAFVDTLGRAIVLDA